MQIRHRQHGQAAVDRLRDAAGEGVGDAADVRPAGIGVRIAERAEHPRQIVRPRQIPRNAVFAAVRAPAVVDLRTDVAGERGKIPVVQSPECAGALEQILQAVGQREVVPLHTVQEGAAAGQQIGFRHNGNLLYILFIAFRRPAGP